MKFFVFDAKVGGEVKLKQVEGKLCVHSFCQSSKFCKACFKFIIFLSVDYTIFQRLPTVIYNLGPEFPSPPLFFQYMI